MRAAIMSLGILSAIGFSTGSAFGQGYILPGVGPVNRSMGGAGTAAPLDATGSLHWNPASITGLPSSRVDLGVDLVINRNQVNSSAGPFSGSTDSDSGYSALPALGLVYRNPDSPVSYGLGVNVIGGFFVNYPGSSPLSADPNPIFFPQTPAPGGFGPAYIRLGFMQISPTVAWEITDRVSIGVAPTINMVDAQASPFPFAPTNADFSYSSATGNRAVWGIGAQAGIFYESPSGVNLGFSVKTPQWFSRFKFNSEDEMGLPRELSTQIEYPMILSLGAAYSGIENLLLAVDVRWIDYASTEAFGESATFSAPPDFTLNGLGWESVWFVALGAQLELTDRLMLRAGYSYNENPIPGALTALNVFAPGIFQHVLNIGASLQLTDSIVASLTWAHGFDNSISGPLISPAGAVPMSKVGLNQEVDSVVLGLSVLF